MRIAYLCSEIGNKVRIILEIAVGCFRRCRILAKVDVIMVEYFIVPVIVFSEEIYN